MLCWEREWLTYDDNHRLAASQRWRSFLGDSDQDFLLENWNVKTSFPGIWLSEISIWSWISDNISLEGSKKGWKFGKEFPII